MSGSVASAFDVALRQQNAKITPHDLLQQFPPPSSSSASPLATPLSECRFYEDFTTAPSDANEKAKLAIDDAIATHGQEHVDAVLASGTHHALRRHRQFDFRLNEDETARLAQHGFMVSERLRAESFAEVYYRLYSDDMPVFITSDSVLHAWHRSFDAFLVELEEEELTPLLEKILDDVRQASERTTPSLAAASVARDVDTFFAVAHALLLGSIDSEKTDAATILDGIQCEQLTTVTLFGTSREVDFSLFKPRGRYTKSPELGRFFRAMTWLGTADFRVAGTDDPASERHQLQCACRVVQLLRDAQVLKRVEAFATILSVLTGDGYGADSMTPMQLHALLGDRDLEALYLSGDSETHLQDLQDEIANHRLGAQAIAGHPLTESVAAAASPSLPTRLPTSFAFLGQQFVWTAFVFSKLVYDQVLDEHQNKVARRLPSAVDAAFAVLGNNGATSELATRMTATPKTSSGFVPFRDGLPYAASLVAVRHVVDATLATAEPASCSVALLWQLALRELSAASASNATVFQSHAWAKRTMNTQLASLAQLRHDTILYAKQSFTMGTRCEYAAGFVDPYPAFWHRMQQLAQRSRDIVGQLRALSADDDESMVQYKARDFFDNFADVTRQLGEIATAQATKQPLRDEQDEFIKNVMEERHGSGGSRYMGWYPSLFYAHREDSGKKDHVVADIHTDVPSVEHGDPGGILHMGVGDVNMGFFVVDKVMYAGPVFSHYEFVTPINARLTDEEFSERLSEFQAPTWATESFLVPN